MQEADKRMMLSCDGCCEGRSRGGVGGGDLNKVATLRRCESEPLRKNGVGRGAFQAEEQHVKRS